MTHSWQNWATLSECKPQSLYFPKSITELKQILVEASINKENIKVVGHGNSYNTNFHTKRSLLSLKEFNTILETDINNQTVTFESGLSIPDLVNHCNDKNIALSNLGTNMFDNVAGACATGHHGSGINFGILSSFIESFDLLLGSGKVLTVHNGDWLYDALGVHLGAFGIITKMTIKTEPRFKLKQTVFPISLQAFNDSMKTILAANDHVKLIWAPHTQDYQCWIANRTNEPNDSPFIHWKNKTINGLLINNILHGLLLYTTKIKPSLVRPINKWLSNYFLKGKTQCIGWSDQIFYLPHLLKQDAVEYAIPIKHTTSFLQDLHSLIESHSFNVQFPIEVRFVKKDNFWLSPAYQSDMCYIGTKSHLLPFMPKTYLAYFKAVSHLVETYKGRFHWGKQNYSSPKYLESVYPKWKDFWILQNILDPNGLFMNDWLTSFAYTPSKTDIESFKKVFVDHELQPTS
tara:strand:+ start:361 stop:1743 length:1383 start_codon:yes stop_codon:yes gene_type:complete